MNKQIELVKKWIADPESVTQEELDAYAYAAVAVVAAAADSNAEDAAYWVKKFEEINDE